ncbi:MAG TPA: RagB/SusD family nutrient uptake outer membrane protein [Longimicrobiales bacterium]
MKSIDFRSRPLSRATRRVLPLVLGIGVLGCDSFLNTEPKAELTTADFFETADQAVQATNATYNMLRAWGVHVFAWIGMTDIVSDDATKGSTPADASFLLDLDNLTFDPGNIAFNDTWTAYYQGIYRANVAIANIPNVEMDEALKARLIGENKFLRAYYYFFLVRAFGGVPLITKPLPAEEFEQTRASADEVYALIEQDLLDAIAVLPQRSEYASEDLGRATKGAAQALLARVYLFRGDFQGAYDQATAVINSTEYGLSADFGTIFTEQGENGPGSVFEVQTVALEEGGGGSQYAQVQGVRGTPNIGWGFNTPSPDLEASFEPGDPRLQATILYPWELLPDGSNQVVYLNPSMQNNRYNQKAFTSPNTPGGSGNSGVDIRRIRYADVLLIAAEAAYRLGNEGDARMYLNRVRERARGDRTMTLGFTPDLLDTRIAVDVLGLDPSTSRAFVRFVGPETDAYEAGLRSFASSRDDEITPIPIRVESLDIIEAVDGTPVTTPEELFDVIESKTPGAGVVLDVLRVSHPEGGAPTTQSLSVTVPAQRLLPDVTAGGEALLEAIWRERRHELAMEQHRWFDLVRQGRAAEVMSALGKTFVTGKHELYPIPAGEVAVAGLQQNPGYN